MTLERRIALAALTISILSVGFTAFQSSMQFKHNRLSVQPALDRRWTTAFDGARSTVELRLLNAGLGPAVVTDFAAGKKGEELAKFSDQACAALQTVFDPGSLEDCLRLNPGVPVMLRPNEDIVVFRLRREGAHLPTFNELLRDIDLSARVCSLYDDCVDWER